MYDGWHFAADRKGCDSLIKLLDILSGETEPAHRTIYVTNPQGVGADRIFGHHDLKLDVPPKVRIGNDVEGTGGIGLSSDGCAIALRPEDIASLSAAVRDVSANRADFGIGFGTSETIVRFWWWPKQREG